MPAVFSIARLSASRQICVRTAISRAGPLVVHPIARVARLLARRHAQIFSSRDALGRLLCAYTATYQADGRLLNQELNRLADQCHDTTDALWAPPAATVA